MGSLYIERFFNFRKWSEEEVEHDDGGDYKGEQVV